MFDLSESSLDNAVIKVIGVGGGGSNAVEHMLTQTIEGVDFICANTDLQALRNSTSRNVLQLGAQLTKGLGAGADPEIGKRAAQEDRIKIQEMLAGADMVFITAGMGGGTGTGAGPIVAEIAKDMGILTVAVVTKPFGFEGRRRMSIAHEGVSDLAKYVDSLITIPNEKLLSVLGKNISLLDAFRAANNVLHGAVQGISELITRPGLINVDFADVRTVMAEMGMAMMGMAAASGEGRATKAAEAAVASPLLEDISLAGANGVLVNITAGMDMSIGEFEEVGDVIKSFTSDEATVVVGTVIDPEMSDELRVTIVVTGLMNPSEITTSTNIPTSLGLRNRNRGVKVYAQPKAKPREAAQPTIVIHRHANDQKTSEMPTEEQKPTSRLNSGPKKSVSIDMGQDDYLDIPTFLRRQSD